MLKPAVRPTITSPSVELPKKPHPKPAPTPAPARSRPPRRAATRIDEEQGFELKLRPTRLTEFIGQAKAKERLAIALKAAKSRGEALDNVLLFGPPGLGKTTLATIIANELDVGFQQTSGPALQIQGDLAAILTNLRERQVLFLDEVHRLQPVLEEKLYTALEDYKLDIIIGQGPAARTHVMEIRPFTFIGATTRPGLLSSPLALALRHPAAPGVLHRRRAARHRHALGRGHRRRHRPGRRRRDRHAAARGTPRIANRLLRRVRDYAQVRALRPHRPRHRPGRARRCSRSTPTASTRSTAACC